MIYPDRDQEDPRFDCTVEAYDFPYPDADAVPVQVASGSVVLFNGYRDIVMVAGHDPYAWRGTADISRPYIRPDKDGGCHR